MKRMRFCEVKKAVIQDFVDTACCETHPNKEAIRDLRSCKCMEDLVYCLNGMGFELHEAYEFIVDTITRA